MQIWWRAAMSYCWPSRQGRARELTHICLVFSSFPIFPEGKDHDYRLQFHTFRNYYIIITATVISKSTAIKYLHWNHPCYDHACLPRTRQTLCDATWDFRSAEAEPLWLMLHNQGWAQLQPNGVRAPPPRDCSLQGSGCPSLPNRTAHAPDCEGSSQRYWEGCWPRGDRLPYQFPISWFPTRSRMQLVQNLSVLTPLSPFYFLA